MDIKAILLKTVEFAMIQQKMLWWARYSLDVDLNLSIFVSCTWACLDKARLILCSLLYPNLFSFSYFRSPLVNMSFVRHVCMTTLQPWKWLPAHHVQNHWPWTSQQWRMLQTRVQLSRVLSVQVSWTESILMIFRQAQKLKLWYCILCQLFYLFASFKLQPYGAFSLNHQCVVPELTGPMKNQFLPMEVILYFEWDNISHFQERMMVTSLLEIWWSSSSTIWHCLWEGRFYYRRVPIHECCVIWREHGYRLLVKFHIILIILALRSNNKQAHIARLDVL